jgi:hypothetical protein
MNALIIRRLPNGDGVDIDLKTDPTDKEAMVFAQWLYELIHKVEASIPEEVK